MTINKCFEGKKTTNHSTRVQLTLDNQLDYTTTIFRLCSLAGPQGKAFTLALIRGFSYSDCSELIAQTFVQLSIIKHSSQFIYKKDNHL